MSPVREREKTVRMLLSEIAPDAWFEVEPVDDIDRLPGGRSTVNVVWFAEGDTAPVSKAAMLACLMADGPMEPVRCSAHWNSAKSCDYIPVSWALLGHTCGRAS